MALALAPTTAQVHHRGCFSGMLLAECDLFRDTVTEQLGLSTSGFSPLVYKVFFVSRKMILHQQTWMSIKYTRCNVNKCN